MYGRKGHHSSSNNVRCWQRLSVYEPRVIFSSVEPFNPVAMCVCVCVWHTRNIFLLERWQLCVYTVHCTVSGKLKCNRLAMIPCGIFVARFGDRAAIHFHPKPIERNETSESWQIWYWCSLTVVHISTVRGQLPMHVLIFCAFHFIVGRMSPEEYTFICTCIHECSKRRRTKLESPSEVHALYL